MAGCRGFSFIGLLIAVALLGIALGGTAMLWQVESRRDKELELLFAGEQIRAAIAGYHDRSPGAAREYPERLEDLLQDKRFLTPVRHLRRLYRDPLAADGEWVLIREQGRIVGVHSGAPGQPLKVAGFAPGQQDFEGATRYAGWRFAHAAVNPAPAAAAAAAPGPQ